MQEWTTLFPRIFASSFDSSTYLVHLLLFACGLWQWTHGSNMINIRICIILPLPLFQRPLHPLIPQLLRGFIRDESMKSATKQGVIVGILFSVAGTGPRFTALGVLLARHGLQQQQHACCVNCNLYMWQRNFAVVTTQSSAKCCCTQQL